MTTESRKAEQATQHIEVRPDAELNVVQQPSVIHSNAQSYPEHLQNMWVNMQSNPSEVRTESVLNENHNLTLQTRLMSENM